jgi:regulator of sirC expression with transglutaminase-like and TPR domain
MPPLCDFEADIEFTKLVGFQRTVSTTQAALELARDARPNLDFQSTLLQLSDIADDVRGQIIHYRSGESTLKAFCDVMAGSHGFAGTTGCFDRADSSYIDQVIETRQGIPISLSLVYVAVAELVGLPIKGVAAPAHFLCRFEGEDGPLYIDAFGCGRVMPEAECVHWLRSISGLSSRDLIPTLQPATPRTIILRMLNNLKTLHLRQNNWLAADLVLRRLLALRPASFVDRRDLASVSLMLGRPGRVLDLFRGHLLQLLPEERQPVDELIASSRQMLAACN